MTEETNRIANRIRVGINGFGVMGRYLLRAIQKEVLEGKLREGDVEVVAINDPIPVEQLAPLLQHDSVYLGFPGKVERAGRNILLNGKKISVSSEMCPSCIPWGDHKVDVIYESSGAFVKNHGIEDHLDAGAKKVICSAPSDFAEITIVMGVNDNVYRGEKIISGASCTTNCLAPVALALLDAFGRYRGSMTTIHAYTADQRLQDSPHHDTARAYAAGLNLAPTSTGAAAAIGKVIPRLEGRLIGKSIRVPLAVGSIVDLTVSLDREVTVEEVDSALREAAGNGLSGTLEYRDGPVVSSMVLGHPVPSVVDASQTQVNKNVVAVQAHYDNVAGYSHQAIRLIKRVGSHQPATASLVVGGEL